jgi:hypothetical protein
MLRHLLHDTTARTVDNVEALCRLLAGTPYQSVQTTTGALDLSGETGRLQVLLTAPDSPEAQAIASLVTLSFIDRAVVDLGRELGARVVASGLQAV